MFNSEITKKSPVVAWFSGGVTSAIACKLCLDWFPFVRLVFIDTLNEDADTYRFKNDCSIAWGQEIETIRNLKYNSIQDVWRRYNSLNTANGA